MPTLDDALSIAAQLFGLLWGPVVLTSAIALTVLVWLAVLMIRKLARGKVRHGPCLPSTSSLRICRPKRVD